MFERFEKLQILFSSLIIAFTIIIAVNIFANSASHNEITVTGSSSEQIVSDSGSLNFRITLANNSKMLGYKDLQIKRNIVIKYLKNKGIKNIDIRPIEAYSNYKRDKQGNTTEYVDFYTINLPVTIQSDNVELIKSISTDITTLIDEGVDVIVDEPNYSYSKLSELKVKLLEKASLDAKQRAMSMLKPTHNKVGKIQNVKMGVYQITPVNSTEVSDNGICDTTSIDKKVTAVANVSFKIK